PQADDDKFPKKAAAAKDSKDTKTAKKTDGYKSFDARDRLGLRTGDEDVWRKKKIIKTKSQMQEEVIRPKSLKIRLPISVKDLANEMKLKASQLISKLFMQGVAITLNDLLDDETTVQLLGHEFECEITIDTAEEKRIQVTDITIKEEIQQSPASELHLRPPVVTFMGHVDHGKTSLIDAIRKSNRVSAEAGAITQHIGAFKCHTAIGDITILDTPGHEAFSAMRSRGADVTDIVVLVVAGDEGIKAQTLEAMNQALTAGVPIVVAINKSDKPNFNPETVYRQLADQNLLPEAWGGATITVNCSAATGAGVKELLEMLALQAEVLELKANPSFRARGSVIESEMHKGMGAVATILVQNGTLRIGDSIVFGQNYARVKTMHDEHGKELDHAGPSTPVKITGLSGMAEAGSEFVSVKDEKEAKDISEKRTEGVKHTLLHQTKRGSLENLLQQKADNFEKKTLHIIVKADVQGSLEALKTSLLKIPSKKVDINFISEGVGEISESDIQLAAASKATIIGFHTKIESHAENLIKQLKVNIRLHDIIYHAVDDTRELMLGLLDKIPQENEVGKAEVRAVFKSSQLGNIAGCQVIDGVIKRNCIVRVMRNKEVVFKGSISSLKRVKEDVKEVSKGIECGIVLQNFSDVKEGDIIHAIEVTYLKQDLI
ncbi:MAG: translation initiation factor IF-2, partial [Chlamydiae bacterium]|nr:translation initiation factor IF-2 [Chlamydiota bacterium]